MSETKLKKMTIEEIREAVSSGQEMEFSLERESIPVVLKGKDGIDRKYILQEMDGKQRDQYMSFIANKTSGEARVVKDYSNVYSRLLKFCIVDEETGKEVDEKEIQSWPTKVQERLYIMAQVLCGLDEDSQKEKKAKNE